MATDLGKVGMVDKGNYNSGSTYEAMDVVTYNSSTYIAIQNVPVNTAPTNTSYWREAFSNALVGTSDISNVAPTITAAIGNTVLPNGAESLSEAIAKKTAVTFFPVVGVTAIASNCYLTVLNMLCIDVVLEINVALTSRTALGSFNTAPGRPIAFTAPAQTDPGGMVDVIVTGYIDYNGDLYAGDYISDESGFKKIHIGLCTFI